MITVYVKNGDHLQKQALSDTQPIPPNTVWIDLLNMTPLEEKIVEKATGINIPSREEMHEIELSSRLYQEHNAFFMTMTIVSRSDTPQPESHAITFILLNNQLVTLRYIDSQSFILFSLLAEKLPLTTF